MALALLGVVTAVSLLRPLGPASDPRLRLLVLALLGLGLGVTAFLASLRGRAAAEQWAFYGFLVVAVDGLGQVLRPLGWPILPLMALVVASLAVAEPLRRVLPLAGLAGLLALSDALWSPALWREGTGAALGYLVLAAVVDRGLRSEKRRLAATLEELTRLRQGIDHLDELEPTAPTLRPSTAALSLRQISEEGRKALQAEHRAGLDEGLAALVRLARAAAGAHAVVYFDVDRKREAAYPRAWQAPEGAVKDAPVPLGADPFSFVIERDHSFYATDFPRLLAALPWYARDVKVGTLLALPVRVGGAVVGVLVADRLEIQGFTGSEPEVLEGFAELAGRALQAAREALSREETGTEFKAIYAVSRNLAVLEEPEALRRVLLRSARDMVPAAESVALVVTDDALTRYEVAGEAYGWPSGFAGREVGLTERTYAAWVLRSGEDLLLESVAEAQERMPILTLDEGASRAESLLVVPLKARNRTLGALVVTARKGTFRATALRVLGLLANQAAAALATIRLVERNKQLAIRDGLTRLYNRRAFDENLARLVAQEERKPEPGRFCVLLVDLDHFKKLNDTYGHQAGDEALRRTARLLERHLRKQDLAARYGGEEFVVILPGTDEEGARRLAERAREAIAGAKLVFEGARLALTASLGVAEWPSQGREPEALLAAADRALYAAKDAGRNRVVTASALPAAEVGP